MGYVNVCLSIFNLKHVYTLNPPHVLPGVCSGEFGLQPEPSLVLSQLVQRHAGPSLSLGRQPSPPSQPQAAPTSASPASQHTSAPVQAGPVIAAGAKPPAPSAGLDPQGGSTPQQQRAQLKGQKRRIPPTSKVRNTFEHRQHEITNIYIKLVFIFRFSPVRFPPQQ